jgi:hypothetical protein
LVTTGHRDERAKSDDDPTHVPSSGGALLL